MVDTSLSSAAPDGLQHVLRNQHRLRSSLTTHQQPFLFRHARLPSAWRVTLLQHNGGITADQFAMISPTVAECRTTVSRQLRLRQIPSDLIDQRHHGASQQASLIS